MTARSVSPLGSVRNVARGRVFILEGDCSATAAIQAAADNCALDVVGVCSDPSQGEGAIREMRPNVVVSDICFGGQARGIELCRLLQEDLGIPVVLVGETSDPWLMLQIAMAQPVGCLAEPP